eukprot:427252-Amphidinium_carterae.2
MKRAHEGDADEGQSEQNERCREEDDQWTLVSQEPHFMDASAPPPEVMSGVTGGAAAFLPSIDGSELVPSESASSVLEVCLDNAELCSQPVMEFDNGLAVAAEPARLFQLNFLRQSQREYSLVLLDPRCRRRGLRLARGTLDSMRQRAECLLAELRGDEKLAHVEPSVLYDRLVEDEELRQHLTGPTNRHITDQASGRSSSSSAAAPAAQVNDTPSENCDEEQECPICLDAIPAGGAAMRCVGGGGRHHYFHARCLQRWVETGNRTCPICRGEVQFNGRNLQDYLQGCESQDLPADARSYLQTVADGLQHKNTWSNMTGLERTAYAGGMVAAAGSGFLMGWYNVGYPIEGGPSSFFEEHQLAQNIGWMAGIFGRVARDILRNQTKREQRRERD